MKAWCWIVLVLMVCPGGVIGRNGVVRAQVIPTNEWVNFWGQDTRINDNPIPVGSVITAYDPDGVLCGLDTVRVAGYYGLLAVYRDDPFTPDTDEGAEPGDTIRFRINGTMASEYGIWSNHGDVIRLELSVQVPDLLLVPAALDFGAVAVTADSTLLLEIQNVGKKNLILYSVTWRQGGGILARKPVYFLSAPPDTLAPAEHVPTVISFAPRLGYGLVQDTLEIQSNDPDSPLLRVPIQGQIISDVLATPEWVSFYSLDSRFEEEALQVGDVVDAFDPQGIHCGVWRVITPGTYGAMPVYRDDLTTPDIDEGAEPGDQVYFMINGYPAEVMGPDSTVWTSNGALFHVDLNGYQNYPPRIRHPIPDLYLQEDEPPRIIADLDTVFSDLEDSILAFSVTSEKKEIQIKLDANHQISIILQANWFGRGRILLLATDSGGRSVSDTVLISVAAVNDRPTQPRILYPLPGAELQQTGYFIWSISRDVDPGDLLRYRLQLAEHLDFIAPVIDTTFQPMAQTAKSYLIRARSFQHAQTDSALVFYLADLSGWRKLRDNTVYYWRVAAVDSHGGRSEWSDSTRTFFFNRVNDPPLAVRSGFNPGDSATVTTVTPTFSWNPADDPDLSDDPGVISYLLEINSPDDPGVSRHYTTEPGITSLTLGDPLQDDFSYSYRVKAFDDDSAFSPWSQTLLFFTNTRLTPPENFTLFFPENGTIDTLQENSLSKSVVFAWSNTRDQDIGDRVTQFVLMYGRNQNLTPADSLQVPASQSDTIQISIELEAGIYYWRVLAVDTDGLVTAEPDSASPPWKYTLQSPTDVPERSVYPRTFSLSQNYPNPFNPVTTITIQIARPARVELAVFALTGRVIRSLIRSSLKAGVYQIFWDGCDDLGEKVPSGVYFYRMRADDLVITKKMILIQ